MRTEDWNDESLARFHTLIRISCSIIDDEMAKMACQNLSLMRRAPSNDEMRKVMDLGNLLITTFYAKGYIMDKSPGGLTN